MWENRSARAGMLKAVTQGQGRPYIPGQFCVLTGHEHDHPHVALFVDGEFIRFDAFRPAKGTARGAAKWFAEWRPEGETGAQPAG